MTADFFKTVEPSCQVLLIGNDHESEASLSFVSSRAFIEAALDHGFTKFLIEQPEHTKPETIRNMHPLHDDLGLTVIPVDPRSDDLHERIHLEHEALSHILADYGDDVSDAARRVLSKSFDNIREKALSEDDKLLDRIKEESENDKVIVFYGSLHFADGTILERGIPRSDRHIVVLHDDDVYSSNSQNNSSDTRLYNVTVKAAPAVTTSGYPLMPRTMGWDA